MSVDLDGIGFSIKGTRIKLFSPGKTVTLNIPTASVANVSTSPSVECRPNRSIVLLNMAGEVVMTWTKEHLELLVEYPAVEKYWELRTGATWHNPNSTLPNSSNESTGITTSTSAFFAR